MALFYHFINSRGVWPPLARFTVTRSVLNEYYKAKSTKPADQRQKTILIWSLGFGLLALGLGLRVWALDFGWALVFSL